MARALRKPEDAGNQALKPVPDSDLWDKMDEAVQALESYAPPRPPGAFTMPEFRARYNFSEAQGTDRMRKLITQGKVEKYGRSGISVYYVFTNDGQPKPGLKPVR